MMGESVNDIPAIIQGASRVIQAELVRIRALHNHSVAKGDAVEKLVRKTFKQLMPETIGVTRGEVIDKNGNRSSQLDVILYDKSRTPAFTSDASSEDCLIPAEGVIAAIEVKTCLTVDDVVRAGESAKRLKSLERTAYAPMFNTTFFFNWYGQNWVGRVPPPAFFLLSLETELRLERLSSLVANQRNNLSEYWLGLDSICILDKGVVVNVLDSQANGVDCLSFEGATVGAYNTNHALLLLFMLFSKYAYQFQIPPLDMTQYLPRDFIF